MTALAIDHMTIDAANLSEPQARELAARVAAGLAAAGLPDSSTRAIPALRLDLPATGATADIGALARQIVAATLQAIAQAGAGVP